DRPRLVARAVLVTMRPRLSVTCKSAVALSPSLSLSALQPAFPGPAVFFGLAWRFRDAADTSSVNDAAIDYREIAQSAPLRVSPHIDAGRISRKCRHNHAAWSDKITWRLATVVANTWMPVADDEFLLRGPTMAVQDCPTR